MQLHLTKNEQTALNLAIMVNSGHSGVICSGRVSHASERSPHQQAFVLPAWELNHSFEGDFEENKPTLFVK